MLVLSQKLNYLISKMMHVDDDIRKTLLFEFKQNMYHFTVH